MKTPGPEGMLPRFQRVEIDGGGGRFPLDVACPDCGTTLPPERPASCGGCAAEWRREDGIDVLCRTAADADDAPRELRARLLEEAREHGWRHAVGALPGQDGAGLAGYPGHGLASDMVSRVRGDFRFLLPLGPQSVVLDAGAGWGAHALALASASRWVAAVEEVPERAAFIQLRARQDHVDNLQTVRADPLRPPFPAESFDVVVAPGWRERVRRARAAGAGDATGDFLERMRRLLRPGGAIFLDADLAARSGRGLSRDSLVALLLGAGFGEVRAWMSPGGCGDPARLLPLDAGGAVRHYYECLDRPAPVLTRAARRVGGEAWWRAELRMRCRRASSLLFVARRPDPGGPGEAVTSW